MDERSPKAGVFGVRQRHKPNHGTNTLKACTYKMYVAMAKYIVRRMRIAEVLRLKTAHKLFAHTLRSAQQNHNAARKVPEIR